MSKPWFRKPSRIIPLGLLALGVATAIVWASSPWPAALLIRAMFEKGASDSVDEMLPYVPDGGLDERLNVAYGSGPNETFDTFTPASGTEALPTVIWVHGGAWISGKASNVDPYIRILASKGYTTVSLNYTISPEANYPVAINELNNALAYLVENAAEYHIDPDRLVIAGDSAGANYASQLGVITTNPDYAKLLGITPALKPAQLRGVVLNCGIYDVSGIPNAPGIGGWGFRVALWAYLGEKDWSRTAGGQQMSTLDYVTDDFPTTWISGGNGDPLTPNQSVPLAATLAGLDVDVTTVFYADDHEPSLPHEYQFHLDYADAQTALKSTIDWLGTVTT